MQLDYFHKMVTHKHIHFLVSTPFPCISLTLPLLLWVVRLVVSFWCGGGVIWRVVSIWSPLLGEYYLHVDCFSFLALGSAWCHFYMFASMHLHLSSLVCSAMLHLILWYLVPIIYVSYYFCYS